MNLITNARDAVEHNQKAEKKIGVRTYQAPDENSLVIEVSDNGASIPKHLTDKIFQPFFTTKEPGKGTGLGLSVLNKIIEEHKGRIELESEVNVGTTFKVFLPISE